LMNSFKACVVLMTFADVATTPTSTGAYWPSSLLELLCCRNDDCVGV
jgi:hypothetical protein